MMTTEIINTARAKADKAYNLINDFASNYYTHDLIKLAYPQLDGEQDPKAVAEMMLLRLSVNSLARACDLLYDHLTEVIGDDPELEYELEEAGYCYRENEDGSYVVCYDHMQDANFSPINMYHAATVKATKTAWQIDNHTGEGWATYLKKDWTLKAAIHDQCIEDHIN